MAGFLGYRLRLSSLGASFASTPVHVEMLRDTARTVTFRQAIEAQVKPGMRVVDIGAGSGILGLWALAAGAGHLDAIEETSIGAALERTFAANGKTARARAHLGSSSSIELESKVDLVIAEVLGHFGIDEGILPTCADARRRFAKPEARFIPARVDVVAWPVWVPDFENQLVAFWQAQPFGFELGAMAELSRQGTYVCGEQQGQRLAAPAVLSSHIVGDPAPVDYRGQARFVAEFKSQHNGFFLSFIADLGGGVSLEGWRSDNWKMVFLPTPSVTTLTKGDVVTLELEGSAGADLRYRVSP